MKDKTIPHRILLSAFMANMPDHVYFKDRESRFVWVSDSLAKSFGCAVDEVVGRTDVDFFARTRAQSHREAELEILTTGQPTIDRVVRHIWPDGHVTGSLHVAMPIRDGRRHADGAGRAALRGYATSLCRRRLIPQQAWGA